LNGLLIVAPKTTGVAAAASCNWKLYAVPPAPLTISR
jgi:hypothetical protein